MLLVASALAPVVARAQQLSGTVRDNATGVPIAAAVVTTVAADGREVQLVRTNSQGRYSLVVVPDARTLTFRRLGYRPITVDLTRRRGESVIDAAMERIATVLDPMISAVNQCASSPTRDEAERVWIETGERLRHQPNAVPRRPTKLEVTAYHLTRRVEPNPYIARGTAFTRAFDPEADLLLIEPPHWYRNDIAYTPPTPELFFDRGFFVRHCFFVLPRANSVTGQVGIGFEPVPPSRDINGVLWLDDVTRAPKSISYKRDPAGTSGGTLTFQSMPGGAPFIDSWLYYSGPVQDDTVETVRGVTRRRSRLVMYYRGAALRTAEWSDGTRIDVPSPTVRGRVIDSRTAAPRGGVTVRIGEWEILTASDGFFTAPVPIVDRYSAVVADRTWSAFGVTVTGDPVMLDASSTGAATPIRLASPLDAARRECTGGTIGVAPGVALIRVAGADTTNPVSVTVRWTSGPGRDTVTETTQARNGKLTVCGAPAGSLLVDAYDSRNRAGIGRLQVTGTTIDTLTVTVVPRPPDCQVEVRGAEVRGSAAAPMCRTTQARVGRGKAEE
jgi:hypothetical protein